MTNPPSPTFHKTHLKRVREGQKTVKEREKGGANEDGWRQGHVGGTLIYHYPESSWGLIKDQHDEKIVKCVWFKTIHYSGRGGLREGERNRTRQTERRQKKRYVVQCSSLGHLPCLPCSLLPSILVEDFATLTLKMDGRREGEGDREKLRALGWAINRQRRGKTGGTQESRPQLHLHPEQNMKERGIQEES